MSNESYLSVYAKSFSWAGFFLPKETYKKCSALYDFCRELMLSNGPTKTLYLLFDIFLIFGFFIEVSLLILFNILKAVSLK